MYTQSETELKEQLLYIHEINIRNTIDIQVTLQLLVKKGIVTPEEVQQMRAFVSKQPTYANALQSIENSRKTIEETLKFEQLLTKALSGDRSKPVGDNLTQEEKDYINSRLKEGK